MHEQTTPAAEVEDTAAPEASGSGWQATSVPGAYRRAGAKTYTVRWRGPDGRQRSKGGFRTVKLASAFLAEQKTDVQRGEYRELSTVTLGEHVAGYLAGVPVEELGVETREEYQRDLQRAVEFLGAKTRLVDITTPRLVEYGAHLRQRGGQRPVGGRLSQVSVRRVMAPLQRMLGDAAASGLIRGNPAAAMPRARRQRNGSTRKARALSAEQLQAMIEAAPPPSANRPSARRWRGSGPTPGGARGSARPGA